MRNRIPAIIFCTLLLASIIPITVISNSLNHVSNFFQEIDFKKTKIKDSQFIDTITVDDDGSADFIFIQNAIDNASQGDIIFVYNGIYNEHLIINISIILIGENKKDTVIDGNQLDGNVINVYSNNVTITGFTIQNCGKQLGDSGIKINSNNNIIKDNIICKNEGKRYCYNQGGLFLNQSDNNLILNNTITDNRETGIYLHHSNHNIIEKNAIFKNNNLGIISNASSNNQIIYNEIYNNYCGMTLWPYSSYNTINNNYVHDHLGCGIALKMYSNHNTIRYNRIINNLEWGIMLGFGPTKYNILEYNNISGTSGGQQNWFDGSGLVLSIAHFNSIRYNNFIENKKDIYLENSLFNKWNNNYWDNYSGSGAKIIKGHFAKKYTYHPEIKIPWIAIDLHPANEPYVFQKSLEVGPYTQNVTENSITILWETNIPSKNNYVLFGETTNYRQVKYGNSDCSHHEITIFPNFTYGYYKVVSDDVESIDLTFQLSSHCYITNKFKCAIIGDSRGLWDNWEHATLVAEAVNKDQPNIVVHTGDMVDDGRNIPEWDSWLKLMRPLMQNSTVFGVIGNHERKSNRYYEIFALPENEMWYSFDYGPCHFIILDNYEPWGVNSLQYQWLKTDLSTNDRPFKIVFFHEPIYCSGGHRPRTDVRAVWEPLFNHYNVDLVFQGHCHYYQRTIPINGTIYIVSGGAGAPLYSPNDDWFVNTSKKTFHYCILDVSLDSMKIICSVKDIDRNIFDEISFII
jgi:parallel beta-helix repeat protein